MDASTLKAWMSKGGWDLGLEGMDEKGVGTLDWKNSMRAGSMALSTARSCDSENCNEGWWENHQRSKRARRTVGPIGMGQNLDLHFIFPLETMADLFDEV